MHTRQLCTPTRSAERCGIWEIEICCETNTNRKDLMHFTKLLCKHLRMRGYSQETLNPVFKTAATRLALPTPTESSTGKFDWKVRLESSTDCRRQIFFHLQHHPRGLARKQIRASCDNTIGTMLANWRLTITASRPRNLRDKLCKAKLPCIENDSIGN